MTRTIRRLDRRTVLTITGGTVLGAGLTTLFAGSGNASLTMDDLTVENSDYESEDGEPHSPWFSVDGEYSLDTDSSVESWTVELQVGKTGNSDWETIGETGGPALAQTMNGAYEVSGKVVDHSRWSEDDWHAPQGGEKTHTVPVRVLFDVTGPDGGVVATAKESDDATLTVNSTGGVSDAFVQGDVSVFWHQDEGAPSPV